MEFDIRADGHPVKLSWTVGGSGTGFLALPASDGLVHNGAQLFGNFTPQLPIGTPNGFNALSWYDLKENGGNGDRIIDANDKIFPYLRVWLDDNHDGICQESELHTLPDVGIVAISLDYRLVARTDQFGNAFRFQAKVNPNVRGQLGIGRLAYDVFLNVP